MQDDDSVRRHVVRVEITAMVGAAEPLTIAATAVLPATATSAKPIAMFGFPGGGYNRTYFDLQLDEGPGYSQAAFHAASGFIFVTIDHLGVGESSVPTLALDDEAVARANAAATVSIVEQLRTGALAPGVAPIDVRTTLGLGQSYGGYLVTLSQAHAPCFDALAILGSSGIENRPPWDPSLSRDDVVNVRAGNGLSHPMRPYFHFDDVPESIVVADLTKEPGFPGGRGSWSARTIPGGPALESRGRHVLDRGVVAKEAAAISVPVFVGAGEIDVVADPRIEATAYRSSRDIQISVIPKMAHMHNFASSRHALWARLAHWADGVDQALHAPATR
jgi:pimeloyl-ACP methyl ester carboxylesterase